jgi:hypothetical protein
MFIRVFRAVKYGCRVIGPRYGSAICATLDARELHVHSVIVDPLFTKKWMLPAGRAKKHFDADRSATVMFI